MQTTQYRYKASRRWLHLWPNLPVQPDLLRCMTRSRSRANDTMHAPELHDIQK